MLVEGSGAAALAAILYKKVQIPGKNVGCLICGGNADPNKIKLYKNLSATAMTN
jgi:threonine dehydratase